MPVSQDYKNYWRDQAGMVADQLARHYANRKVYNADKYVEMGADEETAHELAKADVEKFVQRYTEGTMANANGRPSVLRQYVKLALSMLGQGDQYQNLQANAPARRSSQHIVSDPYSGQLRYVSDAQHRANLRNGFYQNNVPNTYPR